MKDSITETRSNKGLIELRAADDGSAPTIRGYAAKFDTLSEFMGGGKWRERIEPGAFDDVLGDDVRALVNHSGLPMARTTSGTLRVSVDNVGLAYEFEPDMDSPDVRSLVSALQRGDIDQSSFAFRTVRANWDFEESESNGLVRVIRKMTSLMDVSIVTYPAYRDTEAESVKRSFDEFNDSLTDEGEAKGETVRRFAQSLI
jgi:HK97 family phage prohead protease